MIYKAVIILLSVAVMTLTPFYVRAQKDGACPRSFLLKMLAATGYLAVGVISQIFLAEKTRFSALMLVALCFSWIGDFFLHLWQRKIYKGIGFCGFLTAHFFFIAAYWTGLRTLMPDVSFFSLPEILFVIIFDIIFIALSVRLRSQLHGGVAVAVLIYASVITTMLCKAVRLGIAVYCSSASSTPVAALIASTLGASLFVMSDFSIAFLMFNDRFKKSYRLKMFNMVTYFAAELLLASLIWLV